MSSKRIRAFSGIKNYFLAAARYPWLLGIVVLSTLSFSLLSVAAPLYIKQFVDLIANSSPEQAAMGALLLPLGMYSLVLFARWVVGRVQIFAVVEIELRAYADLYDSAFTYLIGHSHSFFTSNFAGALQRKVGSYARSFFSIQGIFLFDFFSTLVFLIGAVIVLWDRSPVLGIAVLAWAALFIGIQFFIGSIRHPLRIARAKAESELTGVLADSISNQSTVSQFAAAAHERSMLGKALSKWQVATKRTSMADWWIWGVQGLLAVIIEIGLLFAALYLWQRGLLTIGDFVLIQIYVIGLVERIFYIGNSIRSLYSVMADVTEMVEIFETPYEITDSPNARELSVTAGEIAFDSVGFEFKDSKVVLHDLTLTIRGREKVALVGPSGSGKSTITKLLLRMHDVSGGSIRVDGQDVREVTQESLRQAIAFVPQDPALFHRSLKDNIRYGRPDATDEEVIEAAKKAHCHEFIANLSEGYETHVGERGIKLSGGERQRVAIARAILKNAPILILDEATSALDSESEALIQDALRVLMEGKTVIVIAHRLSTIMTMDRILVLEHGRIVAEGTHDELVLKEGGLYQKLWSIQAGGFLADKGEEGMLG